MAPITNIRIVCENRAASERITWKTANSPSSTASASSDTVKRVWIADQSRVVESRSITTSGSSQVHR